MIKLYTKTICPKCIAAKGMLDNESIEYQTVNTDENEEAKKMLIGLGFMAAPIAEYQGNFYAGQEGVQKIIDDLK